MKYTLPVSVRPDSCSEIAFINNVRAVAEIATPTQSLMVLRCCGNLVPDELPENRTKLAQKIWQTINEIGIYKIIVLPGTLYFAAL